MGHLIGHEGPGSLLSELKSRGWVNTLVGGYKSGAKGFAFFIVNVDLTEEGIEHVDDIVGFLFQYLNMLKDGEPQKWIFEECQNLASMTFRFKDRERPQLYTCALAGMLHVRFEKKKTNFIKIEISNFLGLSDGRSFKWSILNARISTRFD